MNRKIQTNFFCRSNHWSKRMLKIKKIVTKMTKINDLGFKNNNFYFVNLVFVDDKKIKNINKIFRKKNKPTDVLTFVNIIKNNKNKNEIKYFMKKNIPLC